jgi:parallel beta-helix repeat protein
VSHPQEGYIHLRNAHLRRSVLLGWTALVFFGFTLRAQTTIHVPVDAPTIQSAIDAARNGDTVFVSPGTYNENLDFKGKAITVTTGATRFSDASAVVVNGTADGPVVNFTTNEPPSSVLNGFTLQGGHSKSNMIAGGILISNASPTITNNIVSNNFGCGIYVINLASPLIQGNDVKGTSYSNDSNFQCNSAYGAAPEGTGIALSRAGNVQLIGNTIEDNQQKFSIEGSSPGYGAGVSIYEGFEALLQNNIIRNNAGDASPGLNSFEAPTKLILIQNLIYGNTDKGLASPVQVKLEGASSAPYPSLTEINNTIAGAGGGEVIVSKWISSTVANNLFLNTLSVSNPSNFFDEAGLSCGPDTEFTNSNNDIFNEGVTLSTGCPTGQGLLSVDPPFVNSPAFDFHTQRTSPVVATGDINAPAIPPTDLDGKNRTVCGTIDMGVYEVHPQPPIALTVSPNPAPGQSSVNLTATETGNCNLPTGLITFLDGSTILGTATLNGSAVATFSTSFLFVGTHTLTATYPGDFNFDDSTSNTITETITGPPSNTILSVSPNPALPLQPITMTATVSSAYSIPAGTITFMTGGTTLATATVAANGTASATISTLGAGTYPITAVYGGSTEYAASTSNTIVEVVNGAPTTTALTSAPNPSSFGQTVTFTATVAAPQSTTTPTGTVTFMDGAAALGSAPLSPADVAQLSASSLTPGSHAITAVFNGSSNDNKSTSNPLIQVVNLNTATLALTSSLNPANVGQPVTFTVTTSGIMPGAIPDAVTFFDGSSSISTAPLNASGTAAVSTSTLSLGTHVITAVLAATTTHTSATSPPVSEVIVQPSFSFTGNSVTVVTGRSGTGDLQLASLHEFTGNVAVTCDPPFPANYTCTLQVDSVALTPGLSKVFTYTLHPSYTASVSRLPPLRNRSRRTILASLFPIALLSLVGLKKRTRRSPLQALLTLAFLAIIANATTACGPDHFIAAPSPGSYLLTFTATGTNKGSNTPVTQVLHLTVTLTP